eukprot:1145228-Rhodomonas_salina.1
MPSPLVVARVSQSPPPPRPSSSRAQSCTSVSSPLDQFYVNRERMSMPRPSAVRVSPLFAPIRAGAAFGPGAGGGSVGFGGVGGAAGGGAFGGGGGG